MKMMIDEEIGWDVCPSWTAQVIIPLDGKLYPFLASASRPFLHEFDILPFLIT
jgi:hypothetical protein